MNLKEWSPYQWPQLSTPKPGEWDDYGNPTLFGGNYDTQGGLNWPEENYFSATFYAQTPDINQYPGAIPTTQERIENATADQAERTVIRVSGGGGGGGGQSQGFSNIESRLRRLENIINSARPVKAVASVSYDKNNKRLQIIRSNFSQITSLISSTAYDPPITVFEAEVCP